MTPDPGAGARLAALLEAHAGRICAAALGVMLLAGLIWSIELGDRLRYADERDFLAIADSLAEHGSYSRDGGETPTAYRAPGYPLLLGAMRGLGAPVLVLRMLGFAALAGAAWCVGRAAEAAHSPAARVLATLGVAFYPLHFYTASTLYPQTLAMLGFAILLERLAVTRERGEFSAGSAAAAAIAATLLVMTVPPMLPAVGILGVALLASARRGRSRLAFVVLALALGVGGWTARNVSAMGKAIPFSTNSGYNLALGNSPNTLASSGLSVDISEWRRAAQGKPELERDRVFRDAALDWIRSEPAAAAGLYVRKFLYFFAPTNKLATAAERASGRDLLMWLSYVPAALLAILGIGLAAARRRSLSWVEIAAALCMFATAGFYAVFFSRLRFRVPVEPALLLIAASYLAEVACGARRRGRPEPNATD